MQTFCLPGPAHRPKPVRRQAARRVVELRSVPTKALKQRLLNRQGPDSMQRPAPLAAPSRVVLEMLQNAAARRSAVRTSAMIAAAQRSAVQTSVINAVVQSFVRRIALSRAVPAKLQQAVVQ